jgi:NAD(P)-dependent dehydrogenase (short-subunit alcohol dehydrogenase family)
LCQKQNPLKMPYCPANLFSSTGFTEALSNELAPFNITCLLVQPGAFRTEFVSNIHFPVASGPSGVSPAYRDTPVYTIITFTKSLVSAAGGDPDKAAQTILDVVGGTGLAQGKDRYLRLPLGSDCKQALEQKFQILMDTLKGQGELIRSTDIK